MRLFEQIRLGTGWFRDSLKTVRLQPLSFTAAVIAYAGIMGLLGLIPIVGIVFAGFFWPFGTIMIAGAGRDTLAGKIPSTRPLAESFAKPDTRLRLVRAGILYSIVLVTAAAIWQFLGADEIAQWQITKDDRVVWSSALQHIPYGAIIASTAFYIPCMMAMWFTPLLIYLKNMTIGKALFYSFTGCLTNLAAVITALFLAFFTFSVMIGCASVLLGVMGAGSIAIFVLLPVTLLGTAIFYGTYYPMWRSVFSEVSHSDTAPDYEMPTRV